MAHLTPFGTLADAYGIRETMTGTGVLVLVAIAVGTVWRRRISAPRSPSF